MITAFRSLAALLAATPLAVLSLVAAEPASVRSIGLSWARKEAVLRPLPNAVGAETVFAFRNDEVVPLRIASISTSCECTIAKADKEIYLPGESGVLRVNFGLRGDEGSVAKFVRIRTEPAGREPVTLRVVLELAENVVLRPKAVAWARSSNATQRIVDVFVPRSETVTLDSVHAENPALSAELLTTATPGLYQIRISTASTAMALQSRILLDATVRGEKRRYSVSASVR